MRSSGSPLWVAFEDPVLRAEGLTSDTYGEAKRFFELTDRQLHNIVCYCHHGVTMTAETTARHVWAASEPEHLPGCWKRLSVSRTSLARRMGGPGLASSGLPSEGGSLAAVFAATYPERCAALILYGAHVHFSQWIATRVMGDAELTLPIMPTS